MFKHLSRSYASPHSQCHKYFIAFYIMLQKTIFSSASRIVVGAAQHIACEERAQRSLML